MKRLFAVLLILVMLIPMCLVAQAEKATEEVEIKPFCLSTWSNFENEYTNVYYMPFFWSDTSTIKKTGKGRVTCPGIEDYEGATLAQRLKSYFDTVPEGARYLNFCLVHDAIHATVEDACIMDNAIPIVNEWLEKFLAEYKSIGGKLDGFFVVVEYMRIYGSYIHGEIAKKDDPLIYSKIVENPVYQEKIRPMLVERGFKFYEPVTEQTPEIFSIHPNSGSQYAQSRSIWDTVMRSYLGQTVYDCCKPLWDYYPDAIVSDYQSKDIKPWVKEISETGGVMGGGGIQTTAGTASNDNFSYNRPKGTFFENTDGTPAYRNIVGYNGATYANTEFNAFLFDANVVKSTYLSSENKNITYWTTPVYYGKNVYYSETLIHMGMVNPKAYHGYIIKGDCGNDQAKYEAALQVVDDCLRDLTNRVGAADRKPIAVEASIWNHSFVLSGMNAGGKNVWRITPDISKATKEAFKIKDNDPTFYINGETITFPGGKIIEDGEVSMVGTCGYWVETDENVYPIITRDDEYFRQHPSYGENFDGYKVGTEFTYNNAKPQAIWEPKKNGTGSATVIADPTNADNKVLAITGSYTLKNVKILKNITAGDTFAEHQGWEVTFTLPKDMAADAEMVLLNASGNKKTSKDGGFKIAGGKVYYSNNGEYVELEGVTLTGGTKYTVLRDMDFTNTDAITCDYYIYSGDTLLGKAMDIPVAAMTVPVDYITMTFTNIAGQAVLLDNYSLYATDVTTDFYLYNATTGMPVAATDKNEGNTAYRLSWYNGTGKEKNYTVMAAYYDGDTKVSEEVVEKITMPAYGDGVALGVVEHTQDGKTMQLYLQDNNAAEDDTNGNTFEIITPEGTQTLEKPINITVGDAGAELWQEPGEGKAQLGTAQSGQQLTVTETITIDGVRWGKVEGGWIKLEKTDYDAVTKDENAEKSFLEENLILIIAGAAVVVIAVVVVVILSAKKKKKTAETAKENPKE